MSEDHAGRERPPFRADHPAPCSDSGLRLRAARAVPVTRQGFSACFDRYFRPVYAYVSRRVSDKGTCERIVREVLTANVELFVERTDERRRLCTIKAYSDRLIELEDARNASAVMPKNSQLGSSGPGGLPATEKGIDDDQRKIR